MVVVATDSVEDVPSKQFTKVPFRFVLTGLITILVTNGKLSSLESLEVVNIELLIVTT
jgi:hypothetical protein